MVNCRNYPVSGSNMRFLGLASAVCLLLLAGCNGGGFWHGRADNSQVQGTKTGTYDQGDQAANNAAGDEGEFVAGAGGTTTTGSGYSNSVNNKAGDHNTNFESSTAMWNDANNGNTTALSAPNNLNGERMNTLGSPGSETHTSADRALNIFGEVDGVGGLSEQFGASENVVQVTFSSEGEDFNPDLDSTGHFVVYASTQHSVSSDIFMKSVDGQTVMQLTSDPADDIMPVFSPDNSQIAYASKRYGNWDLFIMDASGGTSVRLTSDSAHEIHPSWSPDGTHLVFCRLSEQSGRWELWVTEVANPVVRHFIGYGLFPEWCPDPASNKIVFQKARERGSRLFSIWTIDYENGEGMRPTEIASAANAAVVGPTWSNDGKMVSFSTILDPDKCEDGKPEWSDIWVVNVDGSNKINITNGEYTNMQPTWGPEGKVYFVSDRSGKDNIWVIEPGRAIAVARGESFHSKVVEVPHTEIAEVPTEDSPAEITEN